MHKAWGNALLNAGRFREFFKSAFQLPVQLSWAQFNSDLLSEYVQQI